MTPQEFKQKRKNLNLTQRQLAKKLGLSEKNGDRYIRGIEAGDREASGLLIRCFELLEFQLSYNRIKEEVNNNYETSHTNK